MNYFPHPTFGDLHTIIIYNVFKKPTIFFLSFYISTEQCTIMSFMDLTIRQCITQWQIAMSGIIEDVIDWLNKTEKYHGYFTTEKSDTWTTGVREILGDLFTIVNKQGRLMYFGITLFMIAILLIVLRN